MLLFLSNNKSPADEENAFVDSIQHASIAKLLCFLQPYTVRDKQLIRAATAASLPRSRGAASVY